MNGSAAARPHYITLPEGQVRLWQAGTGSDLVIVAGLTLGANVVASKLGSLLKGWRATALELPGIGGSSTSSAQNTDAIADALSCVIAALGFKNYALATYDLESGVLPALLAKLSDKPARTVTIGLDRAVSWANRRLQPPALEPRQDGTHLIALWNYLRDCHLLEPGDETQPATGGEPIPSVEELEDTSVAAAVAPQNYADAWSACLHGVTKAQGLEDISHIRLMEELPSALRGLDLGGSDTALPPTKPLSDNRLWHEYRDTARGRVHLRRAGGNGQPLLVLPTGGGSSAQFAPVITGLAQDRQVFALDYFGNGLSDKLTRDVTIEMLADDAAAVIEALGFEQVDVWGSHTGSLVGLELAVKYPHLVRRTVLEGPVFISPDFQTDLLDNYFPVIHADKWGMHLPLIWNWRRDMFLYWPWYRVERSTARQLGLPRAEELHLYAVGILESGSTYDKAYRSAFTYDTASRLPHLRCPALICAGPNDMLVNGVEESRRFNLPNVETILTPTTVWWPDPSKKEAAETLALYNEFFNR
ncbi:alpha/beta fold hydrolase [Microvirga sp. P5_D2]